LKTKKMNTEDSKKPNKLTFKFKIEKGIRILENADRTTRSI